ncbi:MAG TPA: DoxX family protein [Chloroflexota bacterium]
MIDLGLLILRLTVGSLLAGHGAQKLFGWFEGPGLKGTHGFMEMLGMRPGHVWGTVAALGEFFGGTLTLLGFLNPFGPMNIAAAMTVAIRRVHWSKGIWNSNGGAELPLTNLSVAMAIACTGPGKYSLDRALGIRIPRPVVALGWLWTGAVTAAALLRPEVAQTVLEKAATVMPVPLGSTSSQNGNQDVEVENVPVDPNTTPVQSEM